MQTLYAVMLFAAGLAPCPAAPVPEYTLKVEPTEPPAPKKRYPVSKVVTLLKEMKATLEKEAEEDEEIYDKFACWCTTNDKEKTKAIADAEARLKDLQTTVEELIGQSARLKVEIKALKKEAATSEKALATAVALREKEAAEFTEEEKEMVESIKALEAAIVVLSKHHPSAALLGGGKEDLLASYRTARAQLERHHDLLEGVITPDQRRVITSLAQQEQPWAESYAPQSGQIFGILKQMKETFESDLSDSQKEEIAKQQAFEEMKAAKEEQIAATQAALDDKTQLLASTDENLAQAREDIEDTAASLSADEKFLLDLKQRCAKTDQDWDERTKTRQAEIDAISEAITILTSDEARETFSKTFNPSLVQRDLRTRGGDARQRARALLLSVSSKIHSPKLAALATQAQLDSFTKVKKAIDDMVATLLAEKAEEIQHRDECIGGFHENERMTEAKLAEKDNLETSLKGLHMAKEELETAIAALKEEIGKLKEQQAEATKNRDAENADFQETIADQKKAQEFLAAAIETLKSAYADKKAGITLAQAGGPAPPPPPGFDPYAKHSGAGGVIAMLEQILTDAKLLEKEATEAETNAFRAYQSFMGKTDTSIKEKETGIVNKSEDLAKCEQDITSRTQELSDAETAIEDLGKGKGALHADCDFILKNFEERQGKRDEEIDALRQTKAILSGMKMD